LSIPNPGNIVYRPLAERSDHSFCKGNTMNTEQTPAATPATLGFPGEKDIKEWVTDAVKPLTDPISHAIGDVKGDVIGAGGTIESLAKQLLASMSSEFSAAEKNALGLFASAPGFDKSVSTVENFVKTVLTWDSGAGNKVKTALSNFANTVAPALENSLTTLGQSPAPVQALHDLEGHLNSVDPALLGPLLLVTTHLDLDSAAKTIVTLPGHLTAQQALRQGQGTTLGTASGGEIAILTVKAVLVSVASVCNWIAASIPLSVSCGVSCGVGGGWAAGPEASVKGDVKFLAVTTVVLGGIAMVCQVVAAALDAAAIGIVDSAEEDIKQKLDEVLAELASLKQQSLPAKV
jgi:hypothetical protein